MATLDCETLQCCCCFDNLTDIDTSITKCGHRMHTSCLIKWVSSGRNKTCPLCRSNMIDEDDVINDNETNPLSLLDLIPRTSIMGRLLPDSERMYHNDDDDSNDDNDDDETNPQIPPSTIMNRQNPVTTILNHNANITNDHIPINETNNHQTFSRPRSIIQTLIRNPNILDNPYISSVVSRLNGFNNFERYFQTPTNSLG